MSCIELVCSTPSARSPKEKYSPDVSNFVLWPSATESADTCRPSMRSRQKCSASMRKPGICPGTPSIWGDRRWRSLSRHIDMDACDILCGIALLRLALLVGLLLRRLEIVPSRSIYCERTENLASITDKTSGCLTTDSLPCSGCVQEDGARFLPSCCRARPGLSLNSFVELETVGADTLALTQDPLLFFRPNAMFQCWI